METKQSKASGSLNSNITTEHMRPYMRSFVSGGSRIPSFILRSASYSQQASSTIYNTVQNLIKSSPSDLLSIFLLLLILYVSLRITNLLVSWVWSWVYLFGRLIIIASIFYAAVWCWQMGASDFIDEVGDLITVFTEWVNEAVGQTQAQRQTRSGAWR
jgi:hypothetical protein